jgi:succinoglycan biosynthesis transport protein ExoP
MTKSNRRTASGEGAPELTLRDALSPLFRHRKVVLITFCSVFLAAILLAWFWADRYYVASMQVVVGQDRSEPEITSAATATVNNMKGVTPDQVTSEVTLLTGDDMLRSVATTCKLTDKWSVFDVFLPSDPQRRQAMKQEAVARSLSKKIKAEAATASDVIDVKYGVLGDPETASCVLQNLSALYLEKHLQLQHPSGSSDFFANETEKYRKALDQSEARVAQFSQASGVAAPDVMRTDMAGQVATAEAGLYTAHQMIAADEKRIEDIKQQMATTPERSATTESSLASNLLIQNLQANLLGAQVKRTELLVKYDPSYPLVKEVDAEIAQTQAALDDAQKSTYMNKTTDRDPTYEFLREDLAKTQVDLASQKASAAALVSTIQSMRNEMVKLDGDAVKQAALLRDAKANEANYLLYLTKREQERTSDALDRQHFENVAIAVPAVTPLLPAHSPWLVMLLGLIAAAFCSVAAGYIAEYFDPSFRTAEEVMQTLSMPVLASVPRKVA